jgi:hypothetical protein
MRNYGGTGNDYGNWIEQTMEGGYIITGAYDMSPSAAHQAYLLKLYATGAPAWEKMYGGSGMDAGTYVEQLPSDRGYIVCGYTDSYGGGQEDVYLLRTESDGDTLWTATYGDSMRDWGFEVDATKDGGFIICGSSSSYPPPAADNLYLLKTRPDPAGVEPPNRAGEVGVRATAHPNPFTANTTIAYHVEHRVPVSVGVFDIRGKRVRILVDSEQRPGWHTARWDALDHAGNRVSPGLYLCRFTASGRSDMLKIVLLR